MSNFKFSTTGTPEDEAAAFLTSCELFDYDTDYCWAFPRTNIANPDRRLDCTIFASKSVMELYHKLEADRLDAELEYMYPDPVHRQNIIAERMRRS